MFLFNSICIIHATSSGLFNRDAIHDLAITLQRDMGTAVYWPPLHFTSADTARKRSAIVGIMIAAIKVIDAARRR